MIIRKCTKCSRTFDAFQGSEERTCQICSGQSSMCEEVTDFAVYLLDKREPHEIQNPSTPILNITRNGRFARGRKDDIDPSLYRTIVDVDDEDGNVSCEPFFVSNKEYEDDDIYNTPFLAVSKDVIATRENMRNQILQVTPNNGQCVIEDGQQGTQYKPITMQEKEPVDKQPRKKANKKTPPMQRCAILGNPYTTPYHAAKGTGQTSSLDNASMESPLPVPKECDSESASALIGDIAAKEPIGLLEDTDDVQPPERELNFVITDGNLPQRSPPNIEMGTRIQTEEIEPVPPFPPAEQETLGVYYGHVDSDTTRTFGNPYLSFPNW